ncbi:TonB-linked outer membrane protein, SusC/RagA family [Chitinophaga costaii]|uniref:TonB-linked outer membrane protein, SusC/RagA family n=2 Tax=Chitinophaga costaii TaxID=1335309 RepID=A0A1C4F7H3_9BACT|nr:TonB-linked outer membrane protein, SusC/RagA family [Chitinophaga costaii]
MRPFKLLVAFAVLLCIRPLVYAQQSPVSIINSKLEGKVVDERTGDPLPGAVVIIKSTTHAVSTDASGNFRFATGQKFPYVLIVSYIGYKKQEVVVNGGPVTVRLAENVNELSEIVVNDTYSSQSKKSYTGSAAIVKGATLENKPLSSPQLALQGQVAGLGVAVTSGQPGANVQVRLRGLGSTALSSNPLYVIDGMIVNAGDLSRLTSGINNSSNALAGLNADDIESYTVLKDASATSIYGSRGSNGVIIITTKKGKVGKAQVNLDAETGNTSTIPLPAAGQPLNADQFSTLFIEGLRNAGTYTPDQIAALAESYGFNSGKTTNWQDIIHRTGRQQQYNVSVRGGNENIKVFLSLGYFDQQATIIGSALKRVNGLLNVDQRISKNISVAAGLNVSNVNQLSPVGTTGSWANPVFAASILRPFQRAYNDDGSINSSSSSNTGFVAHYNPLWIAAYDKHTLSQTRALGNLNVNWHIWDQLRFSSYASIDYNVLEEIQFENPILGNSQSSNGSASNAYNRYFNWLLRNQLDYRFNFSKAQDFYLNLTAGYEAQKYSRYELRASGTGFPLTQPDLNALANAATPTLASGSSSGSTFNSVYFRGSSNYKNRYSLSATFRRDASSVFGLDNQYGNFWSIGGAWNIDGERFFENQPILSTAKFHTSFGTTGNAQGIGDYAAQPLASYGSNYGGGNGQNYNGVGNPDLQWEQQKKFDLGVDAGLFEDRLIFNVDYYHNNIYKLIQQVSISMTTGFANIPYANSGSMLNKGVELSVRGIPVKTKSFNWNASFNIAFNNNHVTDVGGNTSVINGNYYFQKGYDYYTYYTRLYAGVNPDNGEALWYTDGTRTKTINDYNKAARVPYKSATPKYFGGFSNTFYYKGIALNVDFYYNFGNYIVDGWSTRFYDGNYYTFNKYQRTYNNRWTTPGQVTDVPKYIAGGGSGGQNQSQAYSSRFLYKGDFIKLKNFTLGYDLKKLPYLQHSTAISKLYVYVRGTNLWTKTYDKKLPYDPESGTVTIPQFKTYTVGLNVGF